MMEEASAQTSAEDLRASAEASTPQRVVEIVRSLKSAVDKFENDYQKLSPELKKGVTRELCANEEPDTSEGSSSGNGVKIINVVRETLDQMLEFLESPLGQRSAELLATHMNKLRVMVEVGIGVTVSGLFVVVVGQLLDVNRGEFNSVIRNIEQSQNFVRSRLPHIVKGVNDARDYLKDLRDAVDRGDRHRVTKIFWHFDETLRLSKMDIDDCEDKLKETNAKIDHALDKINVRMYTSGLFRGAAISAGTIWLYHLIKWKSIPLSVGVVFGGAVMVVGLSILPPVYRSLRETFNEYKFIHDELQSELTRLKRHLENHQRRCESDFRPSRSVGCGEPCDP